VVNVIGSCIADEPPCGERAGKIRVNRGLARQIVRAAAPLAVVLCCVAGCAKQAAEATKTPPPEVTVSKPVVREVTDYFEFPGQTAAVGEVEVRARVAGYIVKVAFIDGQEVKAGDLLFEIDPRPYQATLDRMTAELTRLKAQGVKMQANVKRAEKLRPSNAISEDDYEDSVAQLAMNKASIAAAEASVRDAKLNLEFTRVVSPITGRTSRARITEGNLVRADGSDPTLLTTVVTTNPVYVYFDIDERVLLQYQELVRKNSRDLHPKMLKDLQLPVEIGMANEQGFPHTGVMNFADNKIDRNTGTLRVRGVFENPKEFLTPGLFVRVRIPFGAPHRALLVSERAIGTDQRQKYLLTVGQDDTVEYRPVKVGRLLDGLRVIETGLKPDDLVVVKGLQRARPNSKVQPKLAADTIAAAQPASPEKSVRKAEKAATN
jgi:RND family efflux transporter MFP subunit